MKFAVTIISPPGYVHSAAFSEIAESLHCALIELGHDSVLTCEANLPDRQHIVLGSNLLPQYPMPIPADAILYNLEQASADSLWMRPELIAVLRRFTVWDFSHSNAARLRALGVPVAQVLPIGYAPCLTRIVHGEQDIDVLFYGSLNLRRRLTLESMSAAGLRVEYNFSGYGAERDALMARAKLILNVQFHHAKVLEIARISYALSNRCAVLSEHSADFADDEQFADGVAFVDYTHLTARALQLIADAPERERLAQRGFEIMRARPVSEHLRAALPSAA